MLAIRRVSGYPERQAKQVALATGTRPGPWLRWAPLVKSGSRLADASRRQNGPRKGVHCYMAMDD